MRAPRRIQRRANMSAVLRYCLGGPQTLADIAAGTGITRPAAESVVADLSELGWLTETAVTPQTPRPGRPATYVGLSPDAGHVLSLDIGAHHVTAMAADLAGTVLVRSRRELAEDLSADARLKASTELARKTLSRAGGGPLWTCTVASPGVVHDGRVAYFGGYGMPGWQGIELDEAVRAALGSRVRSAGDCTLGARGESWKGAAAGVDDVVFILAGSRTGAASVINGRVHEGLHGAAGLIGELPQLRWRELEDETFADSLYDGASPRREQLFASARRGEAQALSALDKYADVLATGTAAMVLAVAPQVVVVGGAFSAQADLFLPRFTRKLGELCPFPPQVAASRLGDDAVVMGGLRLALDDILDGIDSIVREADYFPSTSPASLWQ
ncbi:ROK family protein [Actinomyces procaprae]|uniref:ROK family protein n=1 Tax=Actinomyces procaprae TaxID=2560010 RepID=UPI0010A28463|nr:ROK family protein [Actinomyces procaprae]